jgi:hypothetical protein
VPFDLNRFAPRDVEALLAHLNDLTVEVEGKVNVRVFCEQGEARWKSCKGKSKKVKGKSQKRECSC